MKHFKLQNNLKATKARFKKPRHQWTIKILDKALKKDVIVSLIQFKQLNYKKKDKSSIWKVGKRKNYKK